MLEESLNSRSMLCGCGYDVDWFFGRGELVDGFEHHSRLDDVAGGNKHSNLLSSAGDAEINRTTLVGSITVDCVASRPIGRFDSVRPCVVVRHC
jgi:hypothetical protein